MSTWSYTPGGTPLGNSVVRTLTKSGRVLETRMQASLIGGPQLAMALAALEVRVGRLAAKEALEAAGAVIEDEWKNLVRVEDGNYRNSISTKISATARGAAGTIAVRHLDRLVSHTKNPEQEQPYLYAARLEFGSSGVILRFRGRHRQQITAPRRAFPAARPAFDRMKGEAVDRAATVLAAAAYVGTF